MTKSKKRERVIGMRKMLGIALKVARGELSNADACAKLVDAGYGSMTSARAALGQAVWTGVLNGDVKLRAA